VTRPDTVRIRVTSACPEEKAVSRKRPRLLAAFFPMIDDAGFSHRAHWLRSCRTSAHDPLVVVRREGQQGVGAAHRICGSH
jgi:hypothetical protein